MTFWFTAAFGESISGESIRPLLLIIHQQEPVQTSRVGEHRKGVPIPTQVLSQ